MLAMLFGFTGRRAAVVLAVTLVIALLMVGTIGAQEITFRYALDDSPLDVRPKPGEQLTDAVLEFRKTGQNPYNDRADALAEGKKLYVALCQLCHLPDGTGRMGPSLVGSKHKHERIANDVGLFEVVFGGAAGAMQPFSKRLSQDQILKVMAYTRTLMKK